MYYSNRKKVKSLKTLFDDMIIILTNYINIITDIMMMIMI